MAARLLLVVLPALALASAWSNSSASTNSDVGACLQCGCQFCCVSSCDDRCGLDNCNGGCTGCVCTPLFCVSDLNADAHPDSDFCFPDLFTVSISTWDANKYTDAAMRIVRVDKKAGFEREDFVSTQAGAGDARTGYFLRDINRGVQWNVTEDGDGHVTGCTKAPYSGHALPQCIARGARYTGFGVMGGYTVSYWRQMLSNSFRVDLVVAENSTDVSGVLRASTISRQGFGVDEFFNYNTSPIPASEFVPPSQCPQ